MVGAADAVMPRLSWVVVMWDPSSGLVQRKAIEATAELFNIRLEMIEVRTPILTMHSWAQANAAPMRF